jgi:flagellar hook-associated protein 1 FlgK
VAIQTTGHNLANVATPGFSRQRVDLVSTFPSFEGGINLGQGVEAAGVRSVVDRFYETQLLSVNTDVGFSEAQSRALAAVQEAFPTTGGIDAALSAFFGALSDLSLNPGGSVERVSLIGKANALGESFRQTREILASVQRHLDNDLDGAVHGVNATLEKIANLNEQIVLTEAEGQPANDFRDQRQILLQRISRLTGATIREEANGQATVLAGGLLLVSGERFGSFDNSQLNAAGFHTLMYQTPDGLSLDATSLMNRGEAGSILTMRDNEVQRIIDQLDLIADTLVEAVNTQHALGFDLNGTAGGDFFNSIAVTAGASSNIGVNAAVAANPRLIAAAQSVTAIPGDNRNVLSLLNLRSTTFAALGDLAVQDSFLSLIGEVGTAAEAAQAGLDFRNSLLTQTQARRDSVSGVNIDEEMTKLILFQRTFEASSLLVRTADEMYRALIDMAS